MGTAQTVTAFGAVDSTWTIFLDRDGVINRKLENDYVKNLDELELLPGAVEAIVALSHKFQRLVVVTNQQGIGKGLMTDEDLATVHQHVEQKVTAAGGKIDAFYYAPQLAAEGSEMRKPGIGMAKKAQADFPEIDFSRSIMVGDSPSDMEFASKAGMVAVHITEKAAHLPHTIALPSLASLASSLLRKG